MNSIIKLYSPEDMGGTVSALTRNGYSCLVWAELDQQTNSVVYLINFTAPQPAEQTTEQPKERQVLNEGTE